MATYVAYGERIVELPSGNHTVLCAFCDKEIPRSDQHGDLLGFEDYRGNHFCDEQCEMLSRLDQRHYMLQNVKDCIKGGYESLAGTFAKQLTTFARAFDEVRESL